MPLPFVRRPTRTAPTFSRDFAGVKTLDHGTGPAITFTRASAATYFDANGTLQTASNNAPRFDHDPATGASRGLLIEEQRTNLLLNSATLATQTVTVTAVAHTLSFYGTGEIVLSGVHSATVTGTGVFPTRTTLTFTPTAGSLTIAVSGTAENAQLEIGSFATSYIPTTTASATRAADSAVVSAVSSFYNQIEGTVFSETSANVLAPSTSFVPWAFGDDSVAFGSADTIYASYAHGISHRISLTIFDGGVTQAVINNNGVSQTAGVASKFAAAFRSNDVAASTGGSTVATDATATMPTITGLSLGSTLKAWSSGGNYLNGHIRKFAYWPKRLSDTLLQQLTT